MKKRYNYFDDDYDEQGNVIIQKSFWSDLKDGIDFEKIVSAVKYVISMIAINILLLAKNVAKLFEAEDEEESVQSDSEIESKSEAVVRVNSKPKKKRKRKNPVLVGFISLVFVVIVLTVIIVTSVMGLAGKTNTRQSKFNQSASTVCYEYIERYGTPNYKFMNSEYGVKGCMLTGLCVAREVDFNADNESELLLIYNDNDFYFADVWAYADKEFKQIYSKKLLFKNNRNDDIFFSVYSEKNQHFIAEHNEDDITKVDILKLASDEFKKKSDAQYNPADITYSMRKKNITDSVECIRVAVLRENTAANIVERTLDEIDRFSSSNADGKQHIGTSGISNENSMNTAYYSLVEEYNKNYGVCKLVSDSNISYLDGLASVQLIDFNGDETDELVLIYRRGVNRRKEDRNGNYISVEESEYFCDIYTYNGKNAKLVYQNEGLSNKISNTDIIYFITKKSGKKNLLCSNNFDVSEYGRVVNATSKIQSFDGEKFSIKQKSSYETNYGYTQYYIDGESCSQYSFSEKGGFDVPFFNGEESYSGSNWTITYLQCEPRNEAKLESQVTATKENIKKLNSSYEAS